MHRSLLGLVGVGVAVLSTASQATAGTISGTYVYHVTEICQAIWAVNTNGGVSVAVASNGRVYTQSGYVTFTPSTANPNSGTTSAVLTTVQGSLAILDAPTLAPPDMTVSHGNAAAPVSGTYSITFGSARRSPATFQFSGIPGVLPGGVVDAYLGRLDANGIFDVIDFIQEGSQENSGVNGCAITGHAERRSD